MATTSTPTTTNQTATTVNTVVNDAVEAAEQIVEKTAETALDAEVPFFALPVIKQVSDFVIEDVIGDLGKDVSISLQQVGTFIIIDTQVDGEESGVSKELAALIVAEKSGNPQQIQSALAEYQEAQSALENDDGSATAAT